VEVERQHPIKTSSLQQTKGNIQGYYIPSKDLQEDRSSIVEIGQRRSCGGEIAEIRGKIRDAT